MKTIEAATTVENHPSTLTASARDTAREAAVERQREEALREERARLEEAKRREREREKEVEEREVEVARREKWVVDEMRSVPIPHTSWKCGA